jgi:tagatose 6-phosphate kinase
VTNSKILTITLNPAIDKVYAVDDFAIGGVFRPGDMTATAGGKGLNVARVARLLGESVKASGFVGGANGSFITAQVKKSGIQAEFVSITEESRICIAVMDQKKHTSTEILEPGPTVAPEECRRFIEHFSLLLEDCSVVTASGSLPKGVPADFYRKLIAIANERGIRFLLDTSGEFLEQGLAELPFMIKPNLEEAERLMERSLPVLEDQAGAVIALREKGIAIPCITVGKHGCVAGLPDGVYHFYGPVVEVVNTVGSGDAFLAGCAVGLARQLNMPDIIKLGMASGMANTQFFATGMITLDLVNDFLAQIQFKRIKEYSN